MKIKHIVVYAFLVFLVGCTSPAYYIDYMSGHDCSFKSVKVNKDLVVIKCYEKDE